MREAGLEPARPTGHEDLNLACLPFHHSREGASIRCDLRRHHPASGVTPDGGHGRFEGAPDDRLEAAGPVGDTLLRRCVFKPDASSEAPVAVTGKGVLRRDDVIAADLGRPAGFLFNAATLLQPLDAGRADEVIGPVEEFFDAVGSGEVLLWSAWPTPDLRGRGWRLEGHPPLLIRPAAPLPQAPSRPGLRIEEVSDAGPSDWERVAVDGFPFPGLQPFRPGAMLDDRVLAESRLRLWVGYDDAGPACIGGLFIAFGLAWLTLGVTLPRARHQGWWTAMARHRLLVAPELPAASLFSDMSRPTAQTLGFLPISRFTLWHRQRA